MLRVARFVHSTIKAHDNVIKWKHFPRYWPFVRGIHGLPVNSPHKGQWRGALMFSLICAWMNGWVNNREAGDLRRHCAHYDVIAMLIMLTHCGLNKMIATKRTIFWNAFYTFSSTPNGSTGWQCMLIYIYIHIYITCQLCITRQFGPAITCGIGGCC